MDPRELAIAIRHLARANPPPTLHRYRKPHQWTLAEIAEQKVHLTAPDDQNDPFEGRAAIVWNPESIRRSFVETYAPKRGLSRAAAEKEFAASFDSRTIEMLKTAFEETRRDSGMICLSAVPNSIRMWSYYAQSHEGICLGFDTTKHPFFAASKVTYQDPERPIDVVGVVAQDPTELAQIISLRKAAEWDFEQEYRIMVGTIGQRPRLVPFDPYALTEIRLGAKVKEEFRDKLLEAATKLPKRPKLIQMKCDFERFVLTEESLPQ